MTTKCLQNYLRGDLQGSVPANTITNKTLGARLHMLPFSFKFTFSLFQRMLEETNLTLLISLVVNLISHHNEFIIRRAIKCTKTFNIVLNHAI